MDERDDSGTDLFDRLLARVGVGAPLPQAGPRQPGVFERAASSELPELEESVDSLVQTLSAGRPIPMGVTPDRRFPPPAVEPSTLRAAEPPAGGRAQSGIDALARRATAPVPSPAEPGSRPAVPPDWPKPAPRERLVVQHLVDPAGRPGTAPARRGEPEPLSPATLVPPDVLAPPPAPVTGPGRVTPARQRARPDHRPAPVVHVTIGRLEVTAADAKPGAQKHGPSRPKPALGLGEFLDAREDGRR